MEKQFILWIWNFYIQENGNRYEGEWKEGLKHGRGIFYHIHSGQLQSGIWKNDYSICSTIEDAAFRACSLQATKYPILNIELEDWVNVYTEQEQVVLKDLVKTEESDKRGKEPIYECQLPLADWFYQECCVQTKMGNKYKFHQQLLCD
uniref:MORN repeat-containing protein 3 n=1 Tax=Clastoptera arizonana TaxID=38151 RepID=A0A1B6DTH4_9HEMI